MSQLDQLEAQLLALGSVVDGLAPADPALAGLRAAAARIRGMADGTVPAADVAAAHAARADLESALRAFVDRWKRELGRALLGGLPELPSVQQALNDADWLSGDALSLPGELGPLALRVGLAQRSIAPRLAVAGVPPSQVPLPALSLGPAPPESIGAALSGPFPAQGALRVLPDGVAGALRAPLGPVTVDALASLRRTADGRPSFLGIFGVAFTPAIQLSFGFALDRVGGVIGIERRVDEQALGHEIRSGAASASLFAPAGADPLRRLASAERLFPPAPGRYVVGPLLGLTWLSLGGAATLVHVDLGVLVQAGGPIKVVLVGSARLKLTELLRLQLDLSGVIDVERGRISLDISLVEGRVFGAFRMAGDAAFRAVVSGEGSVVFSAGGFFPGFDPRPAEIGPLRRLSLGPDVPLPGFSVRVEGYVAVTSNTFQLGGRLDLVFDAVAIVATGSLGLDALIQFRPFHFRANVFGRFAVEALGATFCGVTVEGTLDGPGPISMAARLTIETFLKDFHWNETFTFGDGDADVVTGTSDLLAELHAHALEPGLLSASAPEDGDVVLTPRPATGQKVLTAPLGTLTWRQRFSPLHVRCDRYESGPLVPTGQGVDVDVLAPALKLGDELEGFAPGTFLDLSESAALQVPAFEPHVSGLRLGFGETRGTVVDQPPAIKLLRLPVGPGGLVLVDGAMSLARHGELHQLAEVGLRAPVVGPRPAAVTTAPDDWRTADGESHATLTAAWQHARHRAGGLPLHATDAALDTKAV